MEAISAVLTDFFHLIKKSPTEKKKKERKGIIKRQDLLKTIVINAKYEFDVKFQDFKDVYNTKVFMDNFQRPALSDSKLITYVTLEDVKDVVLYTAIYDIPKDFIKLFLSNQVDRMLRSLILYMQYFLEIFRVVVQRREAVKRNKLRHPNSPCIETIWKETLSNLRFIVARDYCTLLMGMNGTAEFHHYDRHRKLSRRSRDLMLYQLLQIFSRRVVQIVLLEKNNELIEEEMDRIFSFGGVKVDRKKKYGLTQLEIDILEHNFTTPTLQSRVVLSKELVRPNRNVQLKHIGETPWLPRNSAAYFLAIEMILAGGESRFKDANIRLGLLGYERQEFDCLLNIETPMGDFKLSFMSDDSTMSNIATPINRLTDKSVKLTGPLGLLPKRDDSLPYDFDEDFLCRCENYNEAHMKIRRPRWIAFRKANSRVNYEPETEKPVNPMEKKIQQRESKARLTEERGVAQDQIKKNELPSFFFSSTAKSDSEDDIFTSFHEGFYNEQLVKIATQNKKKLI